MEKLSKDERRAKVEKLSKDESRVQEIIDYLKDHNRIKTKNISDGYHTFGELYDHRAKLFSVICNSNKELAWKSMLHDDGLMFGEEGEMFIVGITTPKGQYTYHYHVDEYWGLFDVRVLERAPAYDGHMPSDIDRLFSLL